MLTCCRRGLAASWRSRSRPSASASASSSSPAATAASASAVPITVTVNTNVVKLTAGSTLLDAIKLAGVTVPTFCYSPKFKPQSLCRMCLVEVEGKPKLLAACSTVAEDGNAICTDSPALLSYRRTTGQMLLARHPNECMRCEVAGQCKLQSFVQKEELEELWPKTPRGSPEHSEHKLHDHTSPALYRDMDKCIECGLCVQACGPAGQDQNIIGFAERGDGVLPVTIFDGALADTKCISCGQCTSVCPVGALTERPDWHRVLRVLDSRRRRTVVQVAPATRIAIGEEFGMPPGSVNTGRLVRALRELGFDYVFDTNFTADLTIMEEATELLMRVGLSGAAKASNAPADIAAAAYKPLPQFTSCCPGWINWVEINRPDLLRHLSTTKSPQGMLGALAKRGVFPMSTALNAPHETYSSTGDQVLTGGGEFASGDQEVYVVSVMPCTAKKEEGVRPNLRGDVDAVITTRELARMIRSRKIPFASLSNDGDFDSPLGESTGAAAIFGASGGVMEAALRTAAFVLAKGTGPNGEDVEDTPIDFHSLRGELPGVKVATVAGVGDVAVCNGIASAAKLMSNDKWKDQFIAIEVMACVGGCLGGGGEPKSEDPKILEKRTAGIYGIDKNTKKRRSHENEQVMKLYDDFLGQPLSHKSETLLHTSFSARHGDREILGRFLAAVDARNGARAAALFAEDKGTWCTNTEIFGEVVGRNGIEELINSKLPPIKLGAHYKRHLFVDAAYGTVVRTPAGDVVRFEIETEGENSSLRIKRLVRYDHHTEPEPASAESQHVNTATP
jgi:iron-only hydrogenase group A